MITDRLPLCERCGRRPGRPYPVHWGTLERRPLRDDQESGRLPLWVTALTRFELAKLQPPDADGVRWKRV